MHMLFYRKWGAFPECAVYNTSKHRAQTRPAVVLIFASPSKRERREAVNRKAVNQKCERRQENLCVATLAHFCHNHVLALGLHRSGPRAYSEGHAPGPSMGAGTVGGSTSADRGDSASVGDTRRV